MRLARVVSSTLLFTALAPLTLRAQRIEIATHVGYAARAGTLFRLSSPPGVARAWDDGGVDIGATAGWWFGARLGLEGGVDVRFTRYHEDYEGFCSGPPIPGCRVPDPVNGPARQLVASLRVAARRTLGERFRLGASVGPALVEFGRARYPSAVMIETPGCPACGGTIPTLSYLPSRDVLALAAGLSIGYALAPRIRLNVVADDVIYWASPTEDVPAAFWASVVTPTVHQLTFSASLAAAMP
jgi:hypothetical protein